MIIEPETELDKAIAAEWPERWKQANQPAPYKSGWSSNAKRRNRLRRQYIQHLWERRQAEVHK